MRMRLAVLCLTASAIASVPAIAQQPVSHQTLTVSAGLTGSLSSTTVSAASWCVASVEGTAIRYWLDGTAPTLQSGHLVNPGGQFVLPSAQAARGFTMTPQGIAATAQVSCFKGGSPVSVLTTFDPSLAITPTVAVVTSPVFAPALPPCSALVRTKCK